MGRPESAHRPVIAFLDGVHEPFAIRDVVRATGLSTRSVFRVLTRLREYGLLRKENRAYQDYVWVKTTAWLNDVVRLYENARGAEVA